MKNQIKVLIKNGDTETSVNCPIGTSVESLVSHFGSLPSTLAAVTANDEILPLSAWLEVNTKMEPVLLDSSVGMSVYRCSLAFLLAVAARDLFPEHRLYVGHSLGHSYYYTFLDGKKPEKSQIEKLEKRMRELVKENLPINRHYLAYEEAMEIFTKNQQNDTALLLNERSESKVMVNECAGFMDLYIYPLINRTGILIAFELMPYEEGFLLRFPATGAGYTIEPFEDQPHLFTVYNDYKQWGRIVGVHSVGLLNRMVSNRTVIDYIRIAEAFQGKRLDEIANQIYKRKDDVKAILIAGPSSSGKTTTAKKLSIALKVMGIEPIAISLDDYYRGTEHTPKNEKGEPDYECLEALDVPFLNEQLLALLAGDEIALPIYDFASGTRSKAGGRKIKLDRRTMLIIEGIHGLNDALTPSIKRETKFKIYVSALTQLNLDDHNRIPTTDNRLIRRMVRDYQFRGSSAVRTLNMWPDVMQGEKKHIFPFQNGADAAFNSALDYELAVLKFFAEPLLRTIKPGMKQYSEAARLLAFLGNFAPIPPQYVPGTSILREFIGDSEFTY